MVALTLAPGKFRSPPRCRYQAQDSIQTLSEALAEYYAMNADRVLPPDALPAESAALFRSHDICHVIFGLDTTLSDEAMADTRTLLSCDVGWSRYAKYLASDTQAKAIFKQVGYFTVVAGTLRSLPRLMRALSETRKIKKRWPWLPPASFHDRSLSDLRREHGIRVI